MKHLAKIFLWFVLGTGLLNAASSTNQPLVVNTNTSRIANFTNFWLANTNWSVPVDSLFFAPLLHTHAAADITSGTIDPARLGSGTSISTKYLRGDSTWQTVAGGGGDALVANPLSQFAATTSAQLRGVISDETGTGAAVFGTSPTLTTPTLGVASATSLYVGAGAQIGSPTDGIFLLRNNAGTDFERIQLGGTSSSFPAIKRNANTVQIKLADDSNYASLLGLDLYCAGDNVHLGANAAMAWASASYAPGTTPDLFLRRDAANTLAQRNATAAQSYRIYNTFTDASNYERGVMDWGTTANTLTIGTQKAGTGSARGISIVVGGTPALTFDTLGNAQYAGTAAVLGDMQLAAGTQVYWIGKSLIQGGATDGRIRLSNNAQTGFDMLQLGGVSSSFPALKRSGTALQARLADDSGLAGFDAGAITATTVNGTTIPSSATLVKTSDTLAVHAATTSSQLAGVISDETGSGALVLGTSPTITTPTISGAVTFPAGVRQTLAPNSTTPGLNVGSVASDPSSLSNGDVWLNSTSGRLRTRLGGASVDVATGAQQDYELTTVTSGATIAIDLNASQYQTLSLATDATTVTTSNRSATKGRAVTLLVLASGAQRTFTLNGSWRNYNGGSTSVVIPSGKEAAFSFFCTGSAETDVRVSYTVQP